ncbi:nitrite reductase small subunit NirD [Marinomonas pollencensis]|uniref:Assimilatory nitrite reductase (NAD(P)H) small subunit n=1 Tax=Marinomonas pollencensis TaxID=491954 RepID=A0A3E0DN72_9GAMM|nr:nitrite reductase small subunit NirD [Marinomonas pollencensis]REG84163.1 assimilatory nitrite reductase (NAD(P)H) small subunit [Marinomonas pollencensis]
MQWHLICKQSDLVIDAGVAAMVNGQQVALFYVPEASEQVFAIGNWDPIGKANVLSRGLVTHLNGQWSVASPLYKQHYDLANGCCVEQEAKVPVWPTKLVDGKVYIRQSN